MSGASGASEVSMGMGSAIWTDFRVATSLVSAVVFSFWWSGFWRRKMCCFFFQIQYGKCMRYLHTIRSLRWEIAKQYNQRRRCTGCTTAAALLARLFRLAVLAIVAYFRGSGSIIPKKCLTFNTPQSKLADVVDCQQLKAKQALCSFSRARLSTKQLRYGDSREGSTSTNVPLQHHGTIAVVPYN